MVVAVVVIEVVVVVVVVEVVLEVAVIIIVVVVSGSSSSSSSSRIITVKYLVSAHPPPPPPLKHKFLRKVGGGRLLGILPFVQSIIQPSKVQVNTKRLEFEQKSYLFQFCNERQKKAGNFQAYTSCLSFSK